MKEKLNYYYSKYQVKYMKATLLLEYYENIFS